MHVSMIQALYALKLAQTEDETPVDHRFPQVLCFPCGIWQCVLA
jgi:hypothetical protein